MGVNNRMSDIINSIFVNAEKINTIGVLLLFVCYLAYIQQKTLTQIGKVLEELKEINRDTIENCNKIKEEIRVFYLAVKNKLEAR